VELQTLRERGYHRNGTPAFPRLRFGDMTAPDGPRYLDFGISIVLPQ
jgi:hypothetical protein